MKQTSRRLLIAGAAIAGVLWFARGSGRPAPKAKPPPIGPNPLNGRSCSIVIGPPPGSGAQFLTRMGTGTVVNGICVVPGFASLPIGDSRVTVN